MKQLYMSMQSAGRSGQVSCKQRLIFFNNSDEAVGFSLRYAQNETFPVKDGWACHQVSLWGIKEAVEDYWNQSGDKETIEDIISHLESLINKQPLCKN
jgi:hypothetical protein